LEWWLTIYYLRWAECLLCKTYFYSGGL